MYSVWQHRAGRCGRPHGQLTPAAGQAKAQATALRYYPSPDGTTITRAAVTTGTAGPGQKL
jgi:hypothetical protein